MTSRSDVTALLARTLREDAAAATVTPAWQAEEQFWRDRQARTGRWRTWIAVPAAAAAVVASGWFVLERSEVPAPPEPAAPVEQVTPRIQSASIADATSHMIGNGAVVGSGLWFVAADRLITTDAEGRQVSVDALAQRTDGEELCCVEQVGDVVLVPTARGYSHRDAASRAAVAFTPSEYAGPVAVAGNRAWLRTGLDEISLIEPSSGRVVRAVTTPGPADLIAVAGGRLVVASRETATVSLLEPASGTMLRTVELGARPEAIDQSGDRAFVADESGLLTAIESRDGSISRQWQVADAAIGPRPRLVVTGDSLWWSPDAGTVVRLDAATGDLLDAVSVNPDRRWDNGDQQRNGLYVTSDGVWIPTRNDADDYEFHRLPLTLGQP